MQTLVKRPFATTLRRFSAGDVVTTSEDLAPHTFGNLAERGFLETEFDRSLPVAIASDIAHPDVTGIAPTKPRRAV